MKIRGRIFAYKPGHKINTDFSKKMSLIIKNEEAQTPNINFNSKPLMDITQIMKIIPHKKPFLLVDKIFELSETHVIGMKNVI